MTAEDIKKEVEPLINKLNEKYDDVKGEVKDLKARQGRIGGGGTPEPKTYEQAISKAIGEQFEKREAEFKAFRNDKDAKISFDVKLVGDMLSGTHLTGDPVSSYGGFKGIIPAQKVNFRDLIPMLPSPTGTYVHYRETGGEGAIADQVEGADKGQVDFDLTEVKTVSDYTAGYVTFSKQLMYQLPFLRNTLTRMLMRDFYKKENAKFYAAVASGATGNATPTLTTNDSEELLSLIANTLSDDFGASFALVGYTQLLRILTTKPNDYSTPKGYTFGDDGSVRCLGVPIIPVSWATDDKIQIIDNAYIERVETESLRVEFSFENDKNFIQNKVTARVECFEDLNLIRTDAHIYADFGNVA